ncbi:uncharacterized protein LOC132848042 isoform X2 [Tachysurus vachellii]|uniref:uncharacterized protein LOC132848042 isoform X2 n=1 Tax=Tachysurus vachellii TaxID=175792 RepID=UPI00296B2058|nr:uncharacterized protein LOC132848042 isoform X2 [Tachysurus vachellii]
MFSHPRSLLLVLLILRSNTNGNNDFMTRFCLSTDPQSQTEKAHTSAPQTIHTEEQCPTETLREGPTTEECCVYFSFTLPSNKPSTSHEESRQDCPERIVLTKTISSRCEDHETEWLQSVGKAYDRCLIKMQKQQRTAVTCSVRVQPKCLRQEKKKRLTSVNKSALTLPSPPAHVTVRDTAFVWLGTSSDKRTTA